MIDIKKAMLDPTSVFNRPQEVLHANDLTSEQKIEILQRWRYDAELLQIAEEENMVKGGEEKNILQSILEALHALGVDMQ